MSGIGIGIGRREDSRAGRSNGLRGKRNFKLEINPGSVEVQELSWMETRYAVFQETRGFFLLAFNLIFDISGMTVRCQRQIKYIRLTGNSKNGCTLL